MADYADLLKNAPQQDSAEFIEYLRENNRVIREMEEWLIIENIKYHRPAQPWYTAFYKGKHQPSAPYNVWRLVPWYADWEWRKKAVKHQSVPGRYHIHLIKRP